MVLASCQDNIYSSLITQSTWTRRRDVSKVEGVVRQLEEGITGIYRRPVPARVLHLQVTVISYLRMHLAETFA